MNKDQAREILLLYRPGTEDSNDPEIVEALQVAESDAQLMEWFQAQQAVTAALRGKLRSSRVPEGLKEQILSERASEKIVRFPLLPRWGSVPAMAAALAVLLGVIAVLYFRNPSGGALANFRDRMVRIALREYPRMDLETSDLTKIRQFLAGQQAYGDYALPTSLEKATATSPTTPTLIPTQNNASQLRR